MEPKKYDRFLFFGDMELEFLGATHDDDLAMRVVVPNHYHAVNDLFILSVQDLGASCIEKLPAPKTHPVISEVVGLLADSNFREQLISALGTTFAAATPSQKAHVRQSIKKLPKKLKKALLCGEICENCEECSKRIMKGRR